MAKSGLNAMTVALADAFGPKVRVNCILPGAILTDISKAWSEETIANAHKTPMGRAGYAEDFPGAALFFASDASAWITGTCLRVDGGMARQLGSVTMAVERVEYDEFGLFADNASEFGLPYDGPPTVRREFVAVDDEPPPQRARLGLDAAGARLPPRRRPERPHVGHRRAGARPAAGGDRPARSRPLRRRPSRPARPRPTTPPTWPSRSAPWRPTPGPSSGCRSAA